MAFMAFIALAFWSFIASDPPAFPERRGFRFRLAFGLGGAAAFADMAFIAMALIPRRKPGAEQLVSIGDPYEAPSMVVYRNAVKKNGGGEGPPIVYWYISWDKNGDGDDDDDDGDDHRW